MPAFASLRRLRRAPLTAIVLALAASLALAPAAVGADDGTSGSPNQWVWPLTPRPAVVHAFDPPDSPYGAGNRGLDLAGVVGQAVLAVGGGVVTYSGVLGGRGVVVVSHGALRSTYEPVTAIVAVGDAVRVGQPLGVLAAVGSHCPPGACLHLGVLRATRYVDPMALLGDPPIRLKPLSGPPDSPGAPPRSAAQDAAVAAAGYRWPLVR